MTLLSGSTVTDENRPLWLATKMETLGASEIGAALNLNPHYSPLELYLHKTGELERGEPTEEMEWGLRLESAVLSHYCQRNSAIVSATQVYLRHATLPISATLDALVFRTDSPRSRVAEVKTIGAWSRLGLDEKDPETLPDTWQLQVQTQLLLSRDLLSADEADVPVLVGGQRYKQWIGLPYKPDVIDAMLPRAEEFWARVVDRNPPAPTRATDASLMCALYPEAHGEIAMDIAHAMVAEQYFAASAEKNRQEEIAKRLKAELEAILAGREFGILPDGDKIKRSVWDVKAAVIQRKAYKASKLTLQKASDR